MDMGHHSESEEMLLKSLLKKEDIESIEQQIKKKNTNNLKWRQSNFKGILKKEEIESIEQQLKTKTQNDEKCKQSNFVESLLLTGNEIDLKKVLCLHLFAITVPPKPCKRYEDNHKIKQFTDYSFVLPNYFIHNSEEGEHYCKCWYYENKEKIGKSRPCKIHLAVNVKIVEIIETVIEVLNKFNKVGTEKLVSLSHDLAAIKSCLSEKQYIDYIMNLQNSDLFCDLSKLRTEVCTIIKATQKLIQIAHIRKNMVLSLKVSDLILPVNNLFPKTIDCKSVSGTYELQIMKNIWANSPEVILSPILENTKNNSMKILEGNLDNELSIKTNNKCLKRSQQKVPNFYRSNIKRWPYTEKEINIKKELEKIKRINETYLRKYNIKSSQNTGITHKNKLTLNKKVSEVAEVTKLKTLNNTVKIDKKTNLLMSPNRTSIEVSTLNKYHNVIIYAKNNRNSSSESKSEIMKNNKVHKLLREKDLQKERKMYVPLNSEKVVLQSIDIDELKNDLVKVELRSKLHKLISSINNSLLNA